MKKYAALLLCTVAVIGGIFGASALTKEQPIAVKTTVIAPKTVEQTVECTGRVEMAESEEVFLEMPCVAGKVLVAQGQTVKAGDVLFEVDADATQAVLSQFGSAVSGAFPEQNQTITAPIGGKVTQLNVKQGQLADHTAPCAVIAPSDEVCIAVSVREKHLRDVKIGQRVRVNGVGFTKEQYSGTLTLLANSAHQEYIGSVSETVVDAVVTLDEGQADASLRVGLGAVAQVVVDTKSDVLLVPYECLAQNEKGEEYVYVCTADGWARRQWVETAAEYADGAFVVSGVSAGQRLAQSPELLAGDWVRVREGE